MSKDKIVLVGVLKNKRDLEILLTKHWYRIPVRYLPKKKFDYLAFYQPAIFGRKGGRISYYARVIRRKVQRRADLLPEERRHLRAGEDYLKCEVADVLKLSRPIWNMIPRRISFGFIALKRFLSARDILDLYDVAPIEKIMERCLRWAGIPVNPEFTVSIGGRRFRIDLAIFQDRRKIAVECDNRASHSSKSQKEKDRIKDSYLRRAGWQIIRLKEKDIIERSDKCLARIQKRIKVIS